MANRPYFIIECGPEEGKEIQMTADSLVFGRDSSSDCMIPNEKISRQHARVFLQNGKWMLEDLGSKNHTRLDNIKIEPGVPKPLTDGAHIQFATQVVLQFHDPAATLSDDSRAVTDGLWVDIAKGDVYVHNKLLTPKLGRRSFNILALLYEKSQQTPPTIASKTEIEAAGWPGEYGISHEMIDSEVHRIRKRFKELEPIHNFIEAERGEGRKFVQFGKK
jgi:pSer/pThr/pTyr-binding forkhead associated (FHA) protein